MLKVNQTLFGVPDGNCFPACVATVLGIPIEEIPHFCRDFTDTTWYMEFVRWLEPMGYAAVSSECGPEDPLEQLDWSASCLGWAEKCARNVPWIASGPTTRGKHCCVYVGGELFHDPNPNASPKGLLCVTGSTFFTLEKFYR